MATQIEQRVFDDGLGQYVYYTKAVVDPTPTAPETTPNYTGSISSHSIVNITVDVGGSSRPGDLGELLREWNGIDLTGFDTTFKDYEADIGSPAGGNAETACVATVVADPLAYFSGNVLRITATSLAGGGVLAFSTDLVLPSRYIIVITTRGVVSGSLNHLGPCMFDDDVVDDMQGMYINRFGSGNTIHAIVDNRFGSSEALNSSGNIDAFSIARGGGFQIIAVDKLPRGEATALALVGVEDKKASGGINGDTALPHLIAGVGVLWDNRDFDRVGLMVNEGSNNSTFVVDFKEFAVYAHPDD